MTTLEGLLRALQEAKAAPPVSLKPKWVPSSDWEVMLVRPCRGGRPEDARLVALCSLDAMEAVVRMAQAGRKVVEASVGGHPVVVDVVPGNAAIVERELAALGDAYLALGPALRGAPPDAR